MCRVCVCGQVWMYINDRQPPASHKRYVIVYMWICVYLSYSDIYMLRITHEHKTPTPFPYPRLPHRRSTFISTFMVAFRTHTSHRTNPVTFCAVCTHTRTHTRPYVCVCIAPRRAFLARILAVLSVRQRRDSRVTNACAFPTRALRGYGINLPWTQIA